MSDNPKEALKVLQNWKYRLGSTTPVGVLATIPVLAALQEIQETHKKDDLKVILMASGALTQVQDNFCSLIERQLIVCWITNRTFSNRESAHAFDWSRFINS